MAFEIIAVVTNEAKSRLAEMLATGKSFYCSHFALDDYGYDPANPTIALTPDPAQTTCDPDGLPPLFGPKAVEGFTYTGSFCPEFECYVSESEAVGSIGSLCLIATIVYSPTPGDPEIGSTFLFAIAHMPLWVKTDLENRTWLVTIQF